MPSSPELRRERKNAYMREYGQRPEVKARRVWTRPKTKATQAAYMSRPDVQLRNRCARYGLTPEMFYEYLDAQEGACAYCGRELPKELRRIAIDHDHKTGLLRGLVHGPCNTSIGWAEEHFPGYIAAASAAA